MNLPPPRIRFLLIPMTSIGIVGLAVSRCGAGPPRKRSRALGPPRTIARNISFGSTGLLISNKNHSARLQVHGYVQADGRFFSSDMKNQSPDKLLFRRVRPVLEGTLFHTIDFRFMPDFGQNNPQVQDAYLEWKRFPYGKLRLGKFKAPVGLENLRSDSDSVFAERSLASDLVPLRELGVQISGNLLRDRLHYAVGFFNGAGDGSNGSFHWRASNQGVVRVFLQPFAGGANVLHGLGVGAGGSFAAERGALPAFKTVGQNTFFRYSSQAIAMDQHHRFSPQAYYYLGPFGLFAEYNLSSQEIGHAPQARRFANTAWQATASLLLTGENNSYLGIQPRHFFEPQRGLRYLGAWELAARCSRLRVDPEVFPLVADPRTSAAAAAEWGVALNWYLNRVVRIMNSYEHTSFRMAEPGLAPLHGENVVMSRLQLAF